MIDLNKIVRPNILNLMPYSSAREEFKGNDGVFLDANENPYGDLNRYPDPYQKELKEGLSKLKKVNEENIFIGNGSDEVIDLAFRIFCEPGKDKALTFSPTYGMYDVSAGINNIELLKIPLTETFQINTNKLETYWNDQNLKLIFICSPNNPTGNSIALADIETILKNFKGIVIIDEAYIDFSSSESCLKLLETYSNLIISQTFSKAWGLAAARVGIAYANKGIIELYNKVKPPYNISKLNQEAAIKALSDFNEFKKNLQLILDEKEKLKAELESISLVKKIYPSDANFLLVEVEGADEVYDELVVKEIITRNRNKLVKNCIRISVGTPNENEKLITALKNISK
ncbi:MAG: histidinol-phosphate transaminase [Flavobacteriales bacterium]|nr:histidinol-phosphate transaminase [Flavobacteriales bacterium]